MEINVDTFIELAKEPFDKTRVDQRKEMFIHMLIGMLFSTVGTMLGYIIVIFSLFFTFIPILGFTMGIFMWVIAIILVWLFNSYVYGIKWEITKRTYSEDERPVPEFDQSKVTGYMKEGFMLSLVDFGYMLPFIIIGLIIMGFAGMLDYATLGGSDSEGALFGLTMILGMIPMYIIMAVLYWFIIPSAKYFYLKTGSIKSAYRLGAVFEILKKEWRPFLLYAGSLLVIGTITSGIIMMVYPTIFLCIGFILLPLVGFMVITYNTYFAGKALGLIYRDLSAKGY